MYESEHNFHSQRCWELSGWPWAPHYGWEVVCQFLLSANAEIKQSPETSAMRVTVRVIDCHLLSSWNELLLTSAPLVWHLFCVPPVPEEVLIQFWKWETVSAAEKNPTRDVFDSLPELPARSVDLSAFNLTELVNGMLSRALKGNRPFQDHLDQSVSCIGLFSSLPPTWQDTSYYCISVPLCSK